MSDITQWAAWQRGLDEAKRQMASVELKSYEDDRVWPTRDSIDPPAFCLVTNCGLTVTAGSDNCWRHTPLEDPQ